MSTETKVGIFVTFVLVIIAWASLKLGKWDLGGKKGYRLYADFDTASFIEPRSAVLFSGIEVGKVLRTELVGGKGRVWMRIEPGVEIPENAIIWQRLQGFVGVKYLEIALNREEPPGRPLRDGEAIRDARLSPIDSASENLDAVTRNVEQLTESLNETFSQEKGGRALNETLINLNELTLTLMKTLEGRDRQIETIMESLETFSTNMSEFSTENRKIFEESVARLPDLSRRIDAMTAELQRMTERVAQLLDTNVENLDETARSARESSEELHRTLHSVAEMTERIEAGEGTIGRLLYDEETADLLNDTMRGVNEFVQRARTLRAYFRVRSEYLQATGDAKSYFSLRLQPRPDKFYLLELLDSPAGGALRERTTHSTLLDAAGEPISEYTQIEEVTTNSLRFSFQFGKRLGPFTLRGGVIESTGGLGIDYEPWGDTLALSLEGFDFGAATNPHLKATTRLRLFQHIDLVAGADDFINRELSDFGDVDFFVGAGIFFEDRDLSALLGLAPLATLSSQ
ncbi:MAG: MCE family protein [Deltaproteobacteria bacterium]|nr:MAG: MCE family protein [Deltaproteobacteria bacterium]